MWPQCGKDFDNNYCQAVASWENGLSIPCRMCMYVCVCERHICAQVFICIQQERQVLSRAIKTTLVIHAKSCADYMLIGCEKGT